MNDSRKNINPLSRSAKTPSKEAEDRAQAIVMDREILSVFVDASELDYQGIFGVAACFVGQDEIIVKNKKLYDQSNRTKIHIAELKAVLFAFEKLPNILQQKLDSPVDIWIYSDQLFIKEYIDVKDQQTKRLLNEIKKRERQFHLPVTVVYMENEFKKYNPYYKAAHNGARKAIDK